MSKGWKPGRAIAGLIEELDRERVGLLETLDGLLEKRKNYEMGLQPYLGETARMRPEIGTKWLENTRRGIEGRINVINERISALSKFRDP